jgi:KDO2-lipid IV(A) lauroyltransferase
MKPFRKIRRRLRVFLETPAAWFARLVIPCLPWSVLAPLAAVLGQLGYAVASRDRRIALANLDLAFGDTKTHAEKARIARASFVTFARVILDVFWFSRRTRERIRRHVRIEASMRSAMVRSPVVFITAHFGNWEVNGQAVNLAGCPTASVAKQIRNRSVDRMLTEMRQLTGQTIVPAEGALRGVLKFLKQGGSAAFLLDQDVRPEQGGVFVPFFGVPVPMSTAAAALADRVRCPTCVAFCRLDEAGHYTVYATALDEPGEGGDVEAATARIAQHIEDEIRGNPGSWLWMYKRWKRLPPGNDGSRYPYYHDREE